MEKQSLIIISGGMDSITLLYEKKENIALAVSFDYGSNHNKREIAYAAYHCETLDIDYSLTYSYYKGSEKYCGKCGTCVERKEAFAEAEKIYILSAKYGLIEENQIIKPYNETLKYKSEYERKIWSFNICQSLLRGGGVNLEEDEFIILAGENYRKWLIRKLKHYTIPLKGLSLFNQIKYLKSI